MPTATGWWSAKARRRSILEEYEHARAQRRGQYTPRSIGYGTNADGVHVTQPEQETMRPAWRSPWTTQISRPTTIGYVSAHGTATDRGDVAESQATGALFGPKIPISSLKSYTGHTLGACGAIEAFVLVNMMREGRFHPTINLERVDPECAPLDYIVGESRSLHCEHTISNNFAFGGVNTSLVFRRPA